MKPDISISYRYFQNPMTIPFRPHAHELWEFLFITKGNVICMIEGKRHLIDDNTLIVLKPAQIHRIYVSGDRPYEYFSLMCDASMLPSALISRITERGGIVTFKKAGAVHSLFWELNRQNEDLCKVSHQESRALLLAELFATVSDTANRDAPLTLLRDDPIVSDAVRFIESNIHSIVGLDAVCEAVGVTKTILYNHFIKSMLISPTKYIRVKRMALAQMMPQNDQRRVELLKRCGFRTEEAYDRAYEYFYRSVP